MTDFQPFPIQDMRSGLRTAEEPWRSPADSWRDLLNMHVRRGRLEVRKGRTLMGGLYHANSAELSIAGGSAADSIGDTTITSTEYGVLGALPVHPGESSPSLYRVTFWDDGNATPGGQVVKDDGLGNMWEPVTGEAVGGAGPQVYLGTTANLPADGAPWTFSDAGTGQSFTIINGVATGDYDTTVSTPIVVLYSTGAYIVKFAAATTGAVTQSYGKETGTITYATGAYSFTLDAGATADVQVNWEDDPQLPITGIYDFQPESGGQYLIACDTRRVARYSESEERFADIGTADVFTAATYTDHVWFTAFEDKLFLNNGIDVPKKMDIAVVPLAITNAVTDFTGGGASIDFAKAAVRHKGRLIYFHTKESGTEHPQRARRTSVGAPEAFDSSTTFADAPTNAIIQSATVLGDNIIVLCDRGETWNYRYNGDPRAPYDWIKLSGLRGSEARMGAVEVAGSVLALSKASFIATDGNQVAEIDAAIPDLTLDELESDQVQNSVAVVSDELDQLWWTVATLGNTTPNRILHFDRTTGAWGFHDHAMNVLGTFRSTGELLWNDVEEAWDDIEDGFDTRSSVSGFPLVLGGNQTGRIFKLQTGADDAGVPIRWNAKGQHGNPFGPGRAHLGYMDLVVDRIDGQTIDVRLRADFGPSVYVTRTIELDGGTGTFEDKVVRRIRANRIAKLHTLELEGVGAAGLGIDALIPYMKPAGPEVRL